MTTIYIAPGTSQCNVYAMPYPMRKGQHPRDLDWKYQQEWEHIALLNHKLKLVYVKPEYSHLVPEFEGQMGGTYMEIKNDKLYTKT